MFLGDAVSDSVSLMNIDFSSSVFLNLGILVIIGVLGGIIAEKIKLPRVTGYIIAGILFGPDLIGLIPKDFLSDIGLLKVLTLGFVGFNIGMEVKFSFLKHHGIRIVVITFAQALFTFLVVFLLVYLLAPSHNMTYGLILGAIASVTTPTPIVACMRGYKTKGELSDIVCPVVAIDDIIGIFLFTLLLPVGIYIAGHEGEVLHFIDLIRGPLVTILVSVGIGLVLGYITKFIVKIYSRSDNISLELIIVTVILIGVGIGELIGVSDILIPLVIAIVLTNGVKPILVDKIKSNTDVIVLPLLLVFFTLSGADLHIEDLNVIGIISVVYVVFRIFGKVFGTSIAAKLAGESKKISKYLGIMMIPQGGVALEMAILAEVRFLQIFEETGNSAFEEIGQTIFAVVLFAVIVYKVIGEIVVKYAFKHAEEITDNHDDHIPHVI